MGGVLDTQSYSPSRNTKRGRSQIVWGGALCCPVIWQNVLIASIFITWGGGREGLRKGTGRGKKGIDKD